MHAHAGNILIYPMLCDINHQNIPAMIPSFCKCMSYYKLAALNFVKTTMSLVKASGCMATVFDEMS